MPALSPEANAAFLGSPEDPEPEVRGGVTKALNNFHYTIGNEWSLFAFYEDIKDLGGGYLGVGTDQAYLFIGWQRPELAWLADYDPRVKDIHHMYRGMFLAADTPKQFVYRFRKENRKRAHRALATIYEGEELARAKETYDLTRKAISFRLFKQRGRFKHQKVPTYWADQETFDYIKAMLREGRIRSMMVNLNDADGMDGITSVARELEVPIRVLYVSNAEEYWKSYADQYRTNIANLHSDEQSVLLRTKLLWELNRDYQYIVQPLDNYRVWLADPEIKRVRQVLRGRPRAYADKVNTYRMTRLPKRS